MQTTLEAEKTKKHPGSGDGGSLYYLFFSFLITKKSFKNGLFMSVLPHPLMCASHAGNICPLLALGDALKLYELLYST